MQKWAVLFSDIIRIDVLSKELCVKIMNVFSVSISRFEKTMKHFVILPTQYLDLYGLKDTLNLKPTLYSNSETNIFILIWRNSSRDLIQIENQHCRICDLCLITNNSVSGLFTTVVLYWRIVVIKCARVINWGNCCKQFSHTSYNREYP